MKYNSVVLWVHYYSFYIAYILDSDVCYLLWNILLWTQPFGRQKWQKIIRNKHCPVTLYINSFKFSRGCVQDDVWWNLFYKIRIESQKANPNQCIYSFRTHIFLVHNYMSIIIAFVTRDRYVFRLTFPLNDFLRFPM